MDTKPKMLSEEAFALALKGLKEFQAEAFWNWPSHTTPTPGNISAIIGRLRQYGGHKGYMLAGQILRSTYPRPCL